MSADANTTVDLPTLFDPETCTRKGLCPVSSIRNKNDPLESHSLYFEQHGNGPEKVIFIMGCGSSSDVHVPILWWSSCMFSI